MVEYAGTLNNNYYKSHNKTLTNGKKNKKYNQPNKTKQRQKTKTFKN